MEEKRNKGITLVVLVVTIIILLILAGVAIVTLTQTELFDKSKQVIMTNVKLRLTEISPLVRITDHYRGTPEKKYLMENFRRKSCSCI